MTIRFSFELVSDCVCDSHIADKMPTHETGKSIGRTKLIISFGASNKDFNSINLFTIECHCMIAYIFLGI